MAKYIEREADSFKYYVVRNKTTGQYFRGKGVNKWGKYYNQASIYRFKKHAENAVEKKAMRGTQAEVVEIRILEAPTADVVEVRHGWWVERMEKPQWLEDDVEIYWKCSICGCDNFCKSPYCPNCGAKMDGKGENK